MSNRVLERMRKTEWYRESRFGLFIHWGLYSAIGIDEWIQSQEEIPKEQYEKYMDTFTAEHYNPCEWAKQAKQAGMKYAILTAKHHDGFCLFDSKLTKFKSTNTPAGRDLVKDFLEAFRAEGIKVGLYYSLLDWHHADYPHFGDLHHPDRNNPKYEGVNHDFNNYLEYMHGQIKELLTGYGKIDIMWFDFSYDNLKGEAWKPRKIIEMIQLYQPDMIIDNRMEGSGRESGSIMTANPTYYAGDFASPEQVIPPEGICNSLGHPIPWEACVTLNKHWCYNPTDTHYKTAKMLIRMLVDCVSKGGNLLVNIGPNVKGEFPKQSIKILDEIGEWMSRNRESIYGCGKSILPKPEWGRYTQKDHLIFAHVLEESVTAIPIKGLNNRIEQMTMLIDGTEVVETDFWTLNEYKDYTYFFFNKSATDCYPLPDTIDTVVKIKIYENE